MKNHRVGSKVYIGLCMLFLYAPILVLIVFSFNESKSRAFFTGFTFKWYRQLFENERWWARRRRWASPRSASGPGA